jgi:hypothetical protein
MAKAIRVLQVPKSAFNPGRPPSSLLLSQVEQLQKAVRSAIDTEGEAADAIGTLTRLLYRLRPHTQPKSHQETVRAKRKRAGPKRRRVKAKRVAASSRAKRR